MEVKKLEQHSDNYALIRSYVMQGIVNIREIDKKRPDRESIPAYIGKEFGIGSKDVHDVISSLIESGCIVVKKFNGKESFFLKRDSPKSNNQVNFSEDLEGGHNNLFLDFLDTIKTPEKGSQERNVSSNEYSKFQSPKNTSKRFKRDECQIP